MAELSDKYYYKINTSLYDMDYIYSQMKNNKLQLSDLIENYEKRKDAVNALQQTQARIYYILSNIGIMDSPESQDGKIY